MTTDVDVANEALQAIGTRTTISSLTENSNEAIQVNLVFARSRDQLVRMAPWNCARNYANAVLITSVPGTPENTTAGSSTWQKGLPPPPWAYEYQYPNDCLRPLFIVPSFSTGFAAGVPITTAVTGGASAFWQGPPVKFQVAVDQFFALLSATVASGGTGYVVGDRITLAAGPTDVAPMGAPGVLQVATLAGSAVSSVTVVAQIVISGLNAGGSYITIPTNPQAQGSTTGVGTGATFNLTFGSQISQRVILTNQEQAVLCYNKQITNPNLMDPEFLRAWTMVLAAQIAFQLTGDTATANLKIAEANSVIAQARTADGNEGLTVNDVTPDWIRVRGINYPGLGWTPNMSFDWGPMWPTY